MSKGKVSITLSYGDVCLAARFESFDALADAGKAVEDAITEFRVLLARCYAEHAAEVLTERVA